MSLDAARASVQKWEGFLEKLTARVDQVTAEASAGLDMLVAQHPLEAGPMGQALSVVQNRFHNLREKLGNAHDKIYDQLDEILDDSSLGERDGDAVRAMQDRMGGQRLALDHRLERGHELLAAEKQAAWGRQLRRLADAERVTSVNCNQCAGEVPVTVYWRHESVACPFCGAVNEVSPGTAAGLFYSGLGVHALAHHAALPDWEEARAEEDRLNDRRHPSASDRERYLAVERRYWTAYYDEVKRLNPGFDGDVEAAVAAKMKHHTAWDQGVDQQARAFVQRLVDASADPAALATLLAVGVDFDEAAEALLERGDRSGAANVLRIQHRMEDEDDPVEAWVKERLRDLAR